MLEFALRSSIVFAVAWGLTRIMPRATAATRHLVWHGAIIASLLVPLASLANVPKIPLMPQVPEALMPMVPGVLVTSQDTFGTTGVVPSGKSSAIAAHSPAPPSTGAVFPLGVVGILGTLAVALWFTAGWCAAALVSRRSKPAPLAWQLEVNSLRERLGIEHEVKLGLIDAHSSPLATGLFRAAVLLPQTAAAWSPERRRAVLLHELAHIKRRDCRVQLIAQAACALYWFNPFVWLATSRLRRERERACDDEVLRLGAQASSYATHLLDIARELRPAVRPSAALAMARPSELEGRLLSVLAAKRARVPARGTRWAVVSVLSLATAAAVSATTQTPPAPLATQLELDAESQYVVANDIVMSSQPSPEPSLEAELTIRTSADSQAREHAALALAFSSGRDVIPALLKALADPDAQVREKAAIGLALRRDERVVAPLIAAMGDEDSQVREKVAIALGTSGDSRARDVLTRALDDTDSQVREKAAAALLLLGLTGGL